MNPLAMLDCVSRGVVVQDRGQGPELRSIRTGLLEQVVTPVSPIRRCYLVEVAQSGWGSVL